MRNIKLIIEYDGAYFNGWQAQRAAGKKLKTVQEEIEKAAKKLFGRKISLIGASRTDSGVHAKEQTANFRIDSKLPLYNIKNGLNSYLGRRISIISAEEVPLRFHSRKDSTGKLYRYTIINRKSRSPLSEKHSAFVPYDLDVAAMKKAAAIVTNEGGITSHAAIVSRELQIPCIVGAKNATKIFKDGQLVEVDAKHGVIKRVG